MKKFTTLLTTSIILIATSCFGQVVQKASISGTRDAAVCFNIGDKVYMGGGIRHKDFWEYTPATDTWVQKNDLPGIIKNRAFGIGLTVNGIAYVGMGSDNSELKYDLWQYNPVTDSWIQKADYPGDSPTACAFFSVNNKIYLVGGANDVTATEKIYEYDPVTDKWRVLEGAGYPEAQVFFATGFSIGNFGYVTCGSGQSEFKSTFRFNPIDESWLQVASFPGTERQAAVSFVIGELAYVGGGQKAFTEAFKDFYRYNPANNTWASVGEIGDKARAWGVATSVNGKGYVGSGWDFGSTFFDDWWEFTPQNITSVNSIDNTAATHYYNFENQQWFLHKDDDGLSTMKIIDISGKTILQADFEGNDKTVDVHALNCGIYFIEIKSQTNVWREKFMVR